MEMFRNYITSNAWSLSITFEMLFGPVGVDGSDPPAKVSLPRAHKHIRKLQPYSEYVDFIVRTREFFLKAFVKHRDDFPGAAAAHPLLLSSGTAVPSTFVQCQSSHFDMRGMVKD